MIEISNMETSGWNAAIRGMRNPLSSWNKADSTISSKEIILGENDKRLALLLTKAGPSDRKFLRMIHVSMDINAPLYWWKEMDQYKVSTVTDSCSTMHKIHSRDLTLGDFSHEHLTDESKELLISVIEEINKNRKLYKETNQKEYWWQMIQLLGSSYNQKRTWDGNYETLLGIYFQRRHHKLDEWHTLCNYIIELPYMKDLIETLDTQ